MRHARILTRRSSASSRLVDQSANHNSREELVRIEPDLAKGDLLELLHDRYGLDVSALTFVPYGIDSWSYAADCADGRRAFAKLSRPGSTRSGRSQAPLLAVLAAGGVAVPRPIADHDGGFVNRFGGYEVLVLEHLEGRTLEDETTWADDLYDRVARIVGAVHASTDRVQHLVDTRERYELPFVEALAHNVAMVETGGVSVDSGRTLLSLNEVLALKTREVWDAIERLEELRDRARARDSDEVLCHTDIWGSNLLRSGDGTLHLLDWDGALLGPPELDLFMFAGTEFFPADRFGWFLDRYQTAFRRVRLDAETFGFYFYRRTLEDLAGFVEWILEGRVDAMAPEAMLRVVVENLAELPRLEGRLARVATVLENVRRAEGP
jgi:spectinomycin phosphotransferase